ncbi:hypothetical protein C5167_034973 [Papaver somniferum]|uniref:Uncharacterized protein n=1 Tax=Papaver somniferum TaxID=3469 RepID=A0A4Y7KG84_PAPSO|nr:hypothetical protein C5167_034973 [Papaver somniferum]
MRITENTLDNVILQKLQKRLMMARRTADGNGNADSADPNQKMLKEIKCSLSGKAFTVRKVKALNISRLVRISGIVTRCSDFKPLMQVELAVYTCGFEIYQGLSECCGINNAKGKLILQLEYYALTWGPVWIVTSVIS